MAPHRASAAGALGRPAARRARAIALLAAAVWLGLLRPASAAGSAAGTGVAALDGFLDGLHTFRADFTEVVTDAQGERTQQATGQLLVLRPGRFRWEIRPQGEGAGQLLIADGRNLWYYDRELEQVTVRPERTALTATPAMLLSGGPAALAAFDVSSAGTREGLTWVRVAPKAADADFREAQLGYSGTRLRRMILDDKLGETAVFEFARAERNAPISSAEVSFAPPPGVDVIGTAEP